MDDSADESSAHSDELGDKAEKTKKKKNPMKAAMKVKAAVWKRPAGVPLQALTPP